MNRKKKKTKPGWLREIGRTTPTHPSIAMTSNSEYILCGTVSNFARILLESATVAAAESGKKSLRPTTTVTRHPEMKNQIAMKTMIQPNAPKLEVKAVMRDFRPGARLQRR